MEGGCGSLILDTLPKTALRKDKYYEIRDSVRPKPEPTFEPDAYRIRSTSAVHTNAALREISFPYDKFYHP